MTSVRGRRVLIVEDEYFLAVELSRHFEKMGAHVLGPVSNVEAAARQVDLAEAAVLDIDLDGQQVFPIADALSRRDVPFVFYTGRGDIAIPMRFGHAGRLAKPVLPDAVANALFPTAPEDRHASGGDVVSILPKLRLSALLLMGSAAPADRLVELTLETALARVETRDAGGDLEAWLAGLLEDTHRRYGRQLLL